MHDITHLLVAFLIIGSFYGISDAEVCNVRDDQERFVKRLAGWFILLSFWSLAFYLHNYVKVEISGGITISNKQEVKVYGE